MSKFIKMILKFLYFYTSFFLYAWKRSVCKVIQYLRLYYGLKNSEEQKKPRFSFLHERLERKFFYETVIFHPLKVYINGKLSVQNTSTLWSSVKMERLVRLENTFSLDQLNLFHEGSLKLFNRYMDFTLSSAFKNVKIFTDFTMHPHGYETMLRNVCIDDVNIEMNMFDITLYNRSSYFLLSSILKIESFYFLCFLEFIIGLQLKRKFSSTDFFKINLEHSMKSPLIEFLDRTKSANKSSPLTKDIISCIYDILANDNRVILFELFPEFKIGIKEEKSDGESSHEDDSDKDSVLDDS